MLFSKGAVLLALVPFSLAAFECTRSNALNWPEESSGGTGTGSGTGTSSGGSGGGSSISSCGVQCNNDSACILQCMNNQRRSECSAQGLARSDCNDNVLSGDLEVTPELIRSIKNRATYTCDDESTCYLHPDGTLVCVNLQTGDYTSELGVSGNAITGEFTPASAGTSSATAEATPIETGSVEFSSSAISDSKTSTAVPSLSSPVPTKVSTVTSAGLGAVTQTSATPTQSTAGAGKLSAGGVVGALGLVVGLVL